MTVSLGGSRRQTVGDDYRFQPGTQSKSIFPCKAGTDGVDASAHNEIPRSVVGSGDRRTGERVVQIVFGFSRDNYLSIGCAVRIVLEYLECKGEASRANVLPDSQAG